MPAPNTKRRVYDFPIHLVQRVQAYQTANGIEHEVEAVRQLLNETLNKGDTVDSLTARVRDRIEKGDLPLNVASDALVGHPLVSGLVFHPTDIEVKFTDGTATVIMPKGSV